MTEVRIERVALDDRETPQRAYEEAFVLTHLSNCAILYTHEGKTTLVTQNSIEEEAGSGVSSLGEKFAEDIISVFELINENKAEVELKLAPKESEIKAETPSGLNGSSEVKVEAAWSYVIRLPHDKTQESKKAYLAKARKLCQDLKNLLNTNEFSCDKITGIITHPQVSYSWMGTKLLAELSKQQREQAGALARA